MKMNTKMTTIIEFANDFIKEHGSDEMFKKWEKKMPELNKLMSEKKFKDPEAPKKPLSAYMFFCKDQRDAVRDDMVEGVDAKEVTKELGTRWNDLKKNHSGKKEKKLWEKYEKQAADDKKRFEDEMASYDPPTNSQMEKMKVSAKKKKHKSGSKSDKDENAPKAAKSAYIFFTLEERAKIKEEHPEMSAKEIMVELGVRWKELKSDELREDEYARYVEQASEDKKRYQKEKQEYENSDEETKPLPLIRKPANLRDDDEDEEEEEKPKKRRKSGSKLFYAKRTVELQEEFPEMEKEELKALLKKEWTELPKDEKSEWTEKVN
jgi:hypothetical protein